MTSDIHIENIQEAILYGVASNVLTYDYVDTEVVDDTVIVTIPEEQTYIITIKKEVQQ